MNKPGWCRQPLDRFIAARLDAEGLSPAAEADRVTLIRRLTFDLTGLPPTPEEADAFLADASPDAYERLVDRLLGSPRYGERMAIDWLDLARYADTHGYHSDSERQMWRWRDWVIESLNANVPFDQFTIEQLAGDLLPQATLEQRLATGFHRNHMLNDENGAIPEEYLAEYVAERASTTATVWLGQTLECARCHDHKHDPFTQKDFFQLYAFFNNVPENGLGGRHGNAPPVLAVPTRQQQRELEQIAQQLGDLDRRLAARAASREIDQQLASWEARARKETSALNQPPADSALHLSLDEVSLGDDGFAERPPFGYRLKGSPAWVDGKFGQALLADGETHAEVGFPLAGDPAKAFTISAWVFPTTGDISPIVARLDETQYRRGFEFGIERQSLYFRLTHEAGKDELSVRSKPGLKQSRWQHVTLLYDGTARASGVQLLIDGQPVAVDNRVDSLSQHVATDQLLTIGRSDSTTYFRGMLDEIRIFERALTVEEAARLAGGDPIRDILRIASDKRTASQQAELRRYFLEHLDPTFQSLSVQRRRLDVRKAEIERLAPSVMVLAEMSTPRPAHVHLGGRYDLHGEQVSADVPHSLPPLASDQPKNRLGLARWIVSPENPLTARVAANRAWQTLFGAGLVRTPDDFGLLGERPTHPELLDWLACELRDSGWDVKRLHRQLVTSATYRQSSNVLDELWEVDPENRLFARGPWKRLSAEMLRDAALSYAGILESTMGGPSVRPYQPAELWKELAYNPVDYTAQEFEQSHGTDLYRRSVYTFWKRSVPPPNLALLDAPDRERCTVSRSATDSPLQALVLLNDVTFVEAARLLAERAMTEGGESPEGRLEFLARTVLSRQPTKTEHEALLAHWQRQKSRYDADPAAAGAYLSVGESKPKPTLNRADLAAWTSVAATLFNLDESLTQR